MEEEVNVIVANAKETDYDYCVKHDDALPWVNIPLTLDIRCEKIVLRHDSVEIDINSHIEEEIKKFKYIIIHGITFERKE